MINAESRVSPSISAKRKECDTLISVITITYNAATVIAPTLESLNDQSFRNFEHIVVDGASTDNTVALIREMSPDSSVVSEPDKGLYDAMNKGMARARGKYLLFLNAGDSLHSCDTLAAYARAIHTLSLIHISEPTRL